MQFSVATIFTTVLAAASAASALAIQPAHLETRGPIVTIVEEPAVDRRGAAASVASAAGTEAAKQAAKMAVQAVADLISNIMKWNSARQTFTKETVKQMMDNNKDPTIVAAACYNKGYRLQNEQNIDGKTSVNFKLGALHTNYDCMYLRAPNAFWTDSDGGYQNVSDLLPDVLKSQNNPVTDRPFVATACLPLHQCLQLRLRNRRPHLQLNPPPHLQLNSHTSQCFVDLFFCFLSFVTASHDPFLSK